LQYNRSNGMITRLIQSIQIKIILLNPLSQSFDAFCVVLVCDEYDNAGVFRMPNELSL